MYYIKKALVFVSALGQRFVGAVASLPSNIRSCLLEVLNGVPQEKYNYLSRTHLANLDKAIEAIEWGRQECEHLREQIEALKQEIFELESYIKLLVKQQEQ